MSRRDRVGRDEAVRPHICSDVVVTIFITAFLQIDVFRADAMAIRNSRRSNLRFDADGASRTRRRNRNTNKKERQCTEKKCLVFVTVLV